MAPGCSEREKGGRCEATKLSRDWWWKGKEDPTPTGAGAKFRFFSRVCPGFDSWGFLGDPKGWSQKGQRGPTTPGIPGVVNISRKTLFGVGLDGVWSDLGRGKVSLVSLNGI